MLFDNYTMKQIRIALFLARGSKKTDIAKQENISQGYISNLTNSVEFNEFVADIQKHLTDYYKTAKINVYQDLHTYLGIKLNEIC